ncbi:MAG: sugar-binding protein [Armatimonadota bacterium]|nr:sugar-binding protein [Armatimonadota bacterium]
MRIYRFLCLALLLAGVVALSSCRGAPPAEPQIPAAALEAPGTPTAEKVKIGIVTNAVSPFWNPMVKGMERAAQVLGCEASWQGPPNAQVAEQRRILEDFVAKGVHGIALSPIDSKALTPVIDEIQARGVLVITMDSDAPGSGRHAYIGTNNANAGRAAGRAALEVLGEKAKGAKVVAFVGTLSAQNARERLQGFKEATAGAGVQVVDVKQDQTDKSKARRNVEDAIQAYPDAAAFLGLWSYNGPAIAEAVKAAGKRPALKVVCFDAEPQTLAHLRAGEVDATVVQKPYLFGYLSVQLLFNLRRCGVEETMMLLPPSRIIDTGVEVITPRNVEEYQQRLKRLGIESS